MAEEITKKSKVFKYIAVRYFTYAGERGGRDNNEERLFLHYTVNV